MSNEYAESFEKYLVGLIGTSIEMLCIQDGVSNVKGEIKKVLISKNSEFHYVELYNSSLEDTYTISVSASDFHFKHV